MSGATYVALGDSFAAGIGSRTSGDRCRRPGGYPPLLAARLGVDLAYQGCHGATVEDVRRLQLGALGPDTRLVTLTVAGNDAGFTPVILAAAKPGWLVDGVRVIEAARRRTRVTLPLALFRLLRDIRRRSPAAQVVVTGYPQLFGSYDCHWSTFFSTAELAALQAGVGDLDALILGVAGRAGATGVDVRAAFAGHHICSPEPWIHGPTWPFGDSFHPTDRGHAAYADAVAQALHPDLIPAPPTEDHPSPRLTGHPAVTEGPRETGRAPRFGLRELVLAGTRPPVPPP
ncbi:SGNH/GDSL hydrolase family protein [Mobilicoccus sp.]|uniref:SGNH/GDSL hydrolase family protein n=1 Tax=Mobilicoccus sp. TaxID=2034349 RepID=UPI0028A12FB9|nr:SGNH/GDSL hydrolase family protein [Mobilicoccus sp.]